MSLNAEEIIDGKYKIVRLLGEGGMGAVYEGLNIRIQRRVAIKILHGSLAKNEEAVTRFEREAQAAGRIGSKHIAEVLDLGDRDNGDRYLVMEYLDGEDLTRRIRKLGRLTPEEVFPLVVQMLEGLAAAHEVGIVHRDLKPDNVYLLPDGEEADFVKILDFGISKFNEMGAELSMTQTGMVMGTPHYMSPEQAKGSRDIDARADLYAVGTIVYEALSGSLPFAAESFNELILKIVLEDPPPLGPPRNEADKAFFAIVAKAMAREREERFQSAEEFLLALEEWAQKYEVVPARGVQPGSGAYRYTRAQGTDSAWDKTGLGTMSGDRQRSSRPTKRRMPWLLSIAAVVVLAVGGVLVKLQTDEAARAAARARQQEEQRQALEAERQARLEQQNQEQQARLEQRTREAEEARREVEEARQQVEKTRQEVEARNASAPQNAKEEDGEKKGKAASAPVRRAAPVRTAPSRPRSPPKKQESSESGVSKTSTGRTIRSKL